MYWRYKILFNSEAANVSKLYVQALSASENTFEKKFQIQSEISFMPQK